MTASARINSLSVIIPVLNEAEAIGECLDSLINASLPQVDIEILVIDGMSEDKTREIVNQYSQQHEEIYLIDNKQQTTPTGFNKGFEEFSNEIAVLMSGHASVSDNFFLTIIDLFENEAPDADIVGTRVYPDSEGYIQTSIAGALTSRFGAGSKRFRPYAGYVTTVSYGAYRREVIETVGKMDPELPRGQDYDFNKRAREQGFKIYQAAESTVQYEPRSSFTELFRQKMGNGRGKAQISLMNETRLSRILSPVSIGLSVTLLIFFPLLLSLLTTVFVVYLSVMAGSITEVIVRDNSFSPRHFFGILVALVVIHSSFSIGFLIGHTAYQPSE